MQTLVGIAIVMATLFTMWTPANLFSNNLLDQMMRVAQNSPATVYPTLTPSPRLRVGIVSGHMGHDSGAVCPDGLTEAEVNYKIAAMLQTMLRTGWLRRRPVGRIRRAAQPVPGDGVDFDPQ